MGVSLGNSIGAEVGENILGFNPPPRAGWVGEGGGQTGGGKGGTPPHLSPKSAHGCPTTPKSRIRDRPGGATGAPRGQKSQKNSQGRKMHKKDRIHSFSLVQGISHKSRQSAAREGCRAPETPSTYPANILHVYRANRESAGVHHVSLGFYRAEAIPTT